MGAYVCYQTFYSDPVTTHQCRAITWNPEFQSYYRTTSADGAIISGCYAYENGPGLVNWPQSIDGCKNAGFEHTGLSSVHPAMQPLFQETQGAAIRKCARRNTIEALHFGECGQSWTYLEAETRRLALTNPFDKEKDSAFEDISETLLEAAAMKSDNDRRRSWGAVAPPPPGRRRAYDGYNGMTNGRRRGEE